MTYLINVTTTAIEDTLEAFLHYNGIDPELGERFMADLEDRYDAIRKNPFAFSYIDEQQIVRDVVMDHFPYLITFAVEQNVISVYSVANERRKPRSFYKH